MKKVAILYICTGRYDVFWKDFYESCERFFLPQLIREYFVFTDAERIYAEENNPAIHKIYQQRLGWPKDTLLRFQLFSTIKNELAVFDYIFFFNANAQIFQPINPEDVLPSEDEKLTAVLHPGYYNKKPSRFTYESKQKKSMAYIPKGEGKYYFAGGLNGGIAKDYLQLITDLKTNIEKDLSKNIIAVWHDESHLNHYLLNRRPKILSPAYIYPEGWGLPFHPIVLIRDKARLGGHDFLRNVKAKKPLRKKLAGFVKRMLRL